MSPAESELSDEDFDTKASTTLLNMLVEVDGLYISARNRSDGPVICMFPHISAFDYLGGLHSDAWFENEAAVGTFVAIGGVADAAECGHG